MSLQATLRERIDSAQTLLQRAGQLRPGVEGHQKLCGKLRAELRFLRRVEAGEVQVKESHLHSTNLTHLSAIVDSAQQLEGVAALLHVFTYRDAAGRCRTLAVDVVADGGLTWVKAVGRKAEALHNIWQGRGQYGDKSIIRQAEDFLQASRQQEVHFLHPRVVFAFYGGVSRPMADRLHGMGVAVRGDIVAVSAEGDGEEEEVEEEEEDGQEDDQEDGHEDDAGREAAVRGDIVAVSAERGGLVEEQEEEDDSEQEDDAGREAAAPPAERGAVLAHLAFPGQLQVEACPRVNLDITALIAYVSSLSHGRCHLSFREPVLTEQAAQERRRPVLPQMDAFMAGKQLFACRAAVADFQLILDTLGGPGEKERARRLLARLRLVDDQPSERTRRLAPSAKVSRRSLMIFGTGDSLQAVTMTANSRFVRAAANQGVRYSVFVHQPRALTEGKEWRATPV